MALSAFLLASSADRRSYGASALSALIIVAQLARCVSNAMSWSTYLESDSQGKNLLSRDLNAARFSNAFPSRSSASFKASSAS